MSRRAMGPEDAARLGIAKGGEAERERDARERDDREYGPDGLYRYGPQMRRSPLAYLIGSSEHAPPAPTPEVARGQQRLKKKRARTALERQRRFLEAIRGAKDDGRKGDAAA